MDRLGRDKDHLTVNSVVFYSEESIESQLFTIWNKGLDLFQRSLSGLEIITGELNERITEALEDDIYNGLENAGERRYAGWLDEQRAGRKPLQSG